MANDLTLEFELKTLGKEEHKVLNELKQLLERQRGKISSIRLAGLAATALKISLGKANRPEDRMAKALARGLTTRQRLAVEEGGSVSSEEAAHLLGISKTAVLKRHQAARLLARRGAPESVGPIEVVGRMAQKSCSRGHCRTRTLALLPPTIRPTTSAHGVR